MASSSKTFLKSHDFTAWVCVSDIPATVYGEKYEGTQASGYIQASEGDFFYICVCDNQMNPEKGVRLDVSVDGTRIDSRIFRSGKSIYSFPLGHANRISKFSHQPESKGTGRPLVFCKLALVENDGTPQSEIDNMGQIRVDVLRVTNVEPSDRAGSFKPKLEAHGVSERGVKATMSHQVTTGEAEAVPERSQYVKYKKLDSKTSPYRRFTFYYLSKELLEARELLKPPNSLPPTTRDPRPLKRKAPALDPEATKEALEAEEEIIQERLDEIRERKLEAQLKEVQKRLAEKEKEKEDKTPDSETLKMKDEPQPKTKEGPVVGSASPTRKKKKKKTEVIVIDD